MVPTASVATKDGTPKPRHQHAVHEHRRRSPPARPAATATATGSAAPEEREGQDRGERGDEADRQIELADHHDEGRRRGDDRQRRDLLQEVERDSRRLAKASGAAKEKPTMSATSATSVP